MMAHLVLLSLSFMLSHFLLTAQSQDVKVINPILATRVRGKVSYERSASISFHIIMRDAPTGPLPTGPNLCSGSAGTDADPHCPYLFALQGSNDMLHRLTTSQDARMFEKSAAEASQGDRCGKPGNLFPSIFTESEVVNRTDAELASCLNQQAVILEIITDFYFFNLDRPVSTALENYISHYKNVGTSGPINNRAEGSAMSLLNIWGVVGRSALKTAWDMAIHQCRHMRVLPSGLVNSSHLLNALNNLEVDADEVGYELAVSTDEGTRGLYWSLPITDCTLEEPQGVTLLRVYMQVPLVSLGSSWSLHKLTSIPFYDEYNGAAYICTNSPYDKATWFHFDAKSNSTVQSNVVEEGLLQFIPSEAEDEILADHTDLCASSIILNDTEAILDNCPLHCVEQVVPPEAPFIARRGDKNTYYFAKRQTSRTTIVLQCSGHPDSAFDLPPFGALRVFLPCGCSFRVGARVIKADVAGCSLGPIVPDWVVPLNMAGPVGNRNNVVHVPQ